MTSRSLRVRIHNQRPTAIEVALEPWGDVHPLAAQEAATLVVTGPLASGIEIAMVDTGIAVYAGPGDVIDVVDDDARDPG